MCTRKMLIIHGLPCSIGHTVDTNHVLILQKKGNASKNGFKKMLNFLKVFAFSPTSAQKKI